PNDAHGLGGVFAIPLHTGVLPEPLRHPPGVLADGAHLPAAPDLAHAAAARLPRAVRAVLSARGRADLLQVRAVALSSAALYRLSPHGERRLSLRRGPRARVDRRHAPP